MNLCFSFNITLAGTNDKLAGNSEKLAGTSVN